MTHTETEKAIARRTRKGWNESESRALLADLIDRFSAKNLPAALLHHGFITLAQADRMEVAA